MIPNSNNVIMKITTFCAELSMAAMATFCLDDLYLIIKYIVYKLIFIHDMKSKMKMELFVVWVFFSN